MNTMMESGLGTESLLEMHGDRYANVMDDRDSRSRPRAMLQKRRRNRRKAQYYPRHPHPYSGDSYFVERIFSPERAVDRAKRSRSGGES